jgi:hypothetical protein
VKNFSLLTCSLGLAVAIAGCGNNNNTPPDLGAKDLAMPKGGDMTTSGGGKVGDPCTASTDCGEGSSPTCLKQFPGGYCSSKCTKDSDCGSAVCGDVGASSKYCLTSCKTAADCRSGGMYACWTDHTCFPNDAFDCDPTAGSGQCAVMTGGAGGCIRYGIGAGKTGICTPSCQPGKGTCGPDSQGGPQHCIIDDERYDAMGMATMDKYLGGLCAGLVSMPPPVANDMPCTYPDGMGGMMYFVDVCNDGYNCYLMGKSPVNMGYSSAGDNKCRQLCALGPSTNDGGIIPDGGSFAVSMCSTSGQTCHNVFGGGLNVGLCY